MLKAATITMNALLVIGVVYKFIADAPDHGDIRTWLWLGIIVSCPVLNILGLLQWRRRLLGILAAAYNGIAVCVWAFFIFLMMVWPMGNKPKGLELVIILASLALMALTPSAV